MNDSNTARVLPDEGRVMNDDESSGGRRQPKGRIAVFLVLMAVAIVVYAIVLIRLD